MIRPQNDRVGKGDKADKSGKKGGMLGTDGNFNKGNRVAPTDQNSNN